MRLIDADKFLDLLKNSSEGFWRKKQMVNGEPLSEAMSYEMNTIRKCVADADAKAEYEMKWTKVEDGLPEDGERVLIYADTEDAYEIAERHLVEFSEDEYEWEVFSTFGYEYALDDEDVIAWMPIPKYEGVSE